MDYVRWIDQEVLAGVDGPVTLVVRDFGGAVGLAWAVRNPERVPRLVVLNTTANPESLSWGWVAQVPGFAALFAYLFRQRTIFRWMMRAWFRLKDDTLIDDYAQVYAESLTSRTMTRIATSWTFDGIAEIAAGLRRLTCPVQIIWGMEDRYIFPWNPNGERLYRSGRKPVWSKSPGRPTLYRQSDRRRCWRRSSDSCRRVSNRLD